jgi:hypothetical protein
MTVDTQQYFGTASRMSDKTAFEQYSFLILQAMLKMETSTPVRVLSVQSSGVAPVGSVTVRVLVDQLTGDNKTRPGVEIPNVPYFRLQGGANAVIIDPKPGDIGMCSFASRDISSVKSARQSAPPGSLRHHDFSDGMYFGGFLNAAPTQYIHFTESGIVIHSPYAAMVNAPLAIVNSDEIEMNGNVTIAGNLVVDGSMTNNGKDVGSTHTHGGVETGAGNTGVPN